MVGIQFLSQLVVSGWIELISGEHKQQLYVQYKLGSHLNLDPQIYLHSNLILLNLDQVLHTKHFGYIFHLSQQKQIPIFSIICKDFSGGKFSFPKQGLVIHFKKTWKARKFKSNYIK